MANKLKVNKKKTSSSRYFKGLSVAEMDDVEQSVEEALENPAGTFTIVTQELNFRLSNMQKSIKTIGVDTKYIRKAIDKLDKKLDDIGSGGSGFNLGDAASLGAGALALRGGAGALALRGGATALATKGASRFAGRALLGRAGLIGLTALAVHEVMNYVDPPDESGESSLDKWLGRNVFDLNGKMYEWTGIGVDRKKFPLNKIKEAISQKIPDRMMGGGMAPGVLDGLSGMTPDWPTGSGPLNKIKEAISQKIPDRMDQPYGINSMPANVFKEFNPTERAKIIAERLKLMTQVPGMMGGGMAPGVLDGLSGMTPDWPTGSGGGGSTGGGRGGGGGGGWGDDSSAKPSGPSLTPSEFMALEKAGMGGIGDKATAIAGGGQYRPVRELSAADLSDNVINTIAGEARMSSKEGIDAVINTMFNRLGTKAYGKSNTLEDVAMAGKGTRGVQFAGYRKATKEEADKIRARIREIASGQVPDNTKGAQEFRADWYNGPWAQKHPEKVNIGGNNFAKNTEKGAIGTYASYDTPKAVGGPMPNVKDVASKVASATIVNKTPEIGDAKVAEEQGKVASATIVNKTPEIGDAKVAEEQGKVADKRKLPIQPKLKAALAYAAASSGVDLVSVFSGGQPEKGSGGPRTGSIRHDNGNAADVYLYKNGKKLSMDNPEDRKIMQAFVSGARQAGATGIGAGNGYMGPNGIHVGYGTPGTWGAGGKGANAPDWLNAAYNEGDKRPSVDPVQWASSEKAKESAPKVAEVDKKKLRRDVVGYAHGLMQGEKNPAKKVTYANAEVKPPMNKSEQVKTSDTNFLEDRTKTQSAPGKGNMEPTLAEKQAKLKEEHRRYILDKNSDPKPPVQKTYDKTPFKERFPNFSTAADPNFGAKKITPENNPTDVAMEMAKKALEESVKTANAAVAHAKELIKNVVATPPPKLPQSSANKPPLANLPKTAKKGVSNPTDKAPGTDSAKTNTAPPLEDLLPQGGQYFP